MSERVRRSRDILERCRRLGFTLAGVCAAEPTRWERELRDWLDAGRYGEMDWMLEQSEDRLDVRTLQPGARSVLMVADLYASRGSDDEPLDPGRGRVARYCRGRDYHQVIKKRLHRLADDLRIAYPGEEFRSFVDTAPVLERELAERCGIGWVGKHTLVIHPRLGSWMLLGGFVTTMDLETPPEQERRTDHCGSCTRCIEACPTDAITPYSVDATRCISYLTIEHESRIGPELRTGMGAWLVGCDICQEVCPHNSAREGESPTIRDEYAERRDSFDLLDVLNWGEDSRREAFSTSAMKRITLSQMKRNAVIAAGNTLRHHDLPGLFARLTEIAEDIAEDEIVRETAREVLEELSR